MSRNDAKINDILSTTLYVPHNVCITLHLHTACMTVQCTEWTEDLFAKACVISPRVRYSEQPSHQTTQIQAPVAMNCKINLVSGLTKYTVMLIGHQVLYDILAELEKKGSRKTWWDSLEKKKISSLFPKDAQIQIMENK